MKTQNQIQKQTTTTKKNDKNHQKQTKRNGIFQSKTENSKIASIK